jgi:diguanylate cyclase (GGDEF)-like protein
MGIMSEENNKLEVSAGFTAVSKSKEMAESLHAKTPEDDHKLNITAGFTLAEELMNKGELHAANTIYLSLSGSMKQTLTQMAEAKKQEALTKAHPLTGMPNRLALVELLTETAQNVAREHYQDVKAAQSAVKSDIKNAMHSAATYNTCPVVIFIDLEGFKSVNDEHNSTVGDELLCAVGKNLEEHIRPTDHIFHLGGDEFIIVINKIDTVSMLPEHGHKKTALDVVLQNIKETVSSTAVTIENGETISRNAHIGIQKIVAPDIDENASPLAYANSLVAAADKNRLEKKRTNISSPELSNQ